MTARASLAALLALSAIAWGCGDEGIRQARPQLVPPAEQLDFGGVPVLNEKLEHVGVQNVGRATLLVRGARIEEPGAPFSIGAIPTEVVSGESAPVELAFVPPAEAPYTATLVIETDDPDYPEVRISLLGQGSTRAQVDVSPPELDFGRVGECTAAVKSITVGSSGSADLILQSIAFGDGSSPAFSFVGSTKTPSTVKTGTQAQLSVKYTVAQGDAAAQGTVTLSTTDPEQRDIAIPVKGEPNRAPVPAIAPLGNGSPGMLVTLDGAGSVDPDADGPLTYKWTLRSKPLGATTTIDDPSAAVTTMRLDAAIPGQYEVELTVTDATGVKGCAPARAQIVATPAQKLLVEMFWDNQRTDIDLHLLRAPGATLGSPADDCHYASPSPDWGQLGNATDDPAFERDALIGYGPEIIGYVNPVDGVFRVATRFANDHLSGAPGSQVTVRIYHYGVLKAELKKRLEQPGEVWNVADIEWPSGTIQAL